MKKLLTFSVLPIVLLASEVQAGPSWGFTLGNGAGFQWGNNQNNPCYPTYQTRTYYQQNVVYSVPQTAYMRPYQQMQPVYYPQQTIIYNSQPARGYYNNHCGGYQNRW
jgi:hypothetical protein